jgi:hypothetical protein
MALYAGSTASAAPSTGYQPSTAEQNAANQFLATAQGVGGANSVFLGNETVYATNPSAVTAGGPVAPKNTIIQHWTSVKAAQASIGSWTQKQMNDLIAAGVVGGLLKPGDGQIEAVAMWNKLVNQAAVFGAQGQQVTPFDVLTTYTNNTASAGNWKKSSDGLFETNQLTGERRYIGPKYRTNTTTAVTLTDPTTAKAVATSVFQQLLGRDPLPGELNGYASALQQAEQANPTQITTTNQYDDLGNVIATSKQDQKGGFDASAQQFLAAQQAKNKPEYGATQAATTYENAFQNAVFGAPK